VQKAGGGPLDGELDGELDGDVVTWPKTLDPWITDWEDDVDHELLIGANGQILGYLR
jgi:hypothetical protein